MMALGTGLLVTLSCGLVMGGLSRWVSAETPQQRLERLSASQHPIEDAELEQPLLDRVIRPWLRKQVQGAGRLVPAYNIERIRMNLVQAGYSYGPTVLDFFGVKLLAALIAAVATLYLVSLRQELSLSTMMLPASTALLAFLLPDFWLGRRVRQRQGQLRRSLPDALDMLTICVDAGAGLDSGMLKISERWRSALGAEFAQVVAEIRIGLTRREALQNLVWRTNLPEIRSFVAVLLQAEQFGLGIVNVLHMQAEQLRVQRWQRAEEAARRVPIKMLMPLVFMILPALFAVTLGPAIPALLGAFAQATK
jgi:tight adherence protein C